MPTSPALVSALRELGDRPAVIAGGRSISGIGLLLGVSTPGGLPGAVAERVAAHATLSASGARAAEQRLRHWAGILGPPPIRHTVLHPATDLAVDLALATLLAGGTVHCGDPDQDPGDQLAALAGTATTHVSLPSDLLWRIGRVPGLAAYDLSALRLVLHVGPEPRQDDVYAAVDALGAVVAHLREPHSDAEVAEHRLRAAVDAATTAAWKHAIGITAEQIRAFGERLDHAVLTSLLLTLQQYDVLTDPAVGHTEAEILDTVLVTPAYRPQVLRWLDALARRGLITRHGDTYVGAAALAAAEVRETWRPAADVWTDGLGPAAALDRVRRAALRLPRRITGQEPPRPAVPPVRWTAARGYFGAALGSLVRGMAEAHDGPAPLRVLELGDGDGTDTAIARALSARPRQTIEHHPLPDGDRFDVVIATGGGDPDITVTELVRLLAPGGRLLLVAPVEEQLDLLLTGEPGEPDEPGEFPCSAPAERWRAALTAAGCTTVLGLPEDGHPMGLLGQHLFVARVP
ncbi:class I SAM-dependent methyltransferase [Kitasatospora aureofaciens]|uniref:class I SAM-dependent methyltransferase n=1 Tax=Kitasatospora aureofaciens TaxID=1894 RepID=UPI001C48F520|nr:class I SAM-dependent methyltransferase [Kitasatospora aureofaciens]MBV6701997.1 class I SAM-dependent methyltransferase [Kitasatospora aureofaciens]